MGVSRVIGVPHMNVCITMLQKKNENPPFVNHFPRENMIGTIEMNDMDDMEVPPFMDTLNTYTYIYVFLEILTYFHNTFTLNELFALTCCWSMVGPQTWMLPPGVN